MSRLIRTDKSKKRAAPETREILPLTSDTVIQHLKACQNIAVEHARSVFKKYLSDLDEAFNVNIDNARSNQEVSEISGIQRQFRRNRDELERYYCGYIGEGFVKFKKKELHTVLEQSGEGSALSLVDNDDLDETITISSITNKLDTYYAEPIWALNQRFAILNGGEQVTEASNPAAPIQMCESLRRALRLVPLTQKAKNTAYLTYDKTFSELVRLIIEDINAYLKKVGVLPNLKYAPPRSSVKKDTASGDEGSEQRQGEENFVERRRAPSPDANQPTEQYQTSLVQAIKRLQQSMGGERRSKGRRATDIPGAATQPPPTGVVMPPMGAVPSALGPLTSVQGGAASVLGGVGPEGVPAGPTVMVSGEQLLAAIQNLQASNLGVVSAAPATPVAQSAYGADAATGQLSPMNFQGVLTGLAEQLQTKTDGGAARVPEDEMHTIDLVGMVFDYMLSDENLPVSVKALLSYLHTPFLKLAFIDPGFFEQSDHPARMLLNNLAESGCRWVGNDGTDQYEMYAKIKSVVDQVLTEFKNDVRVITEILLDFNSYTKNIVRRQELMERRATEKVQGEERLREVKIRVHEAVIGRTENKELPSAILLFLLQPWSDFLSFTLLRYGDDSGKWEAALSVVDDIIWAIEPKELEVDQVRQKGLHESLAAVIQTGFETIGYDQSKGNKLIETIGSLIKMAMQSEKAEPAPEPMRTKLEKIAEERAGVPAQAPLDFSEEEQKMVERLRMIEFGTWFEFDDGKRLKVAWFNARTSNYMMVDQMGKKVDMLSGLDLARAMLEKRAKIIAGSSKPFFERALENIFQNLNAEAEEQSGEDTRDI